MNDTVSWRGWGGGGEGEGGREGGRGGRFAAISNDYEVAFAKWCDGVYGSECVT